MATEARRRCGYRKVGGIYLMGDDKEPELLAPAADPDQISSGSHLDDFGQESDGKPADEWLWQNGEARQ